MRAAMPRTGEETDIARLSVAIGTVRELARVRCSRLWRSLASGGAAIPTPGGPGARCRPASARRHRARHLRHWEAHPALDPDPDGLAEPRCRQWRQRVEPPAVELELQPGAVLDRDEARHAGFERTAWIEQDVHRPRQESLPSVVELAVEAEEAGHLDRGRLLEQLPRGT